MKSTELAAEYKITIGGSPVDQRAARGAQTDQEAAAVVGVHAALDVPVVVHVVIAEDLAARLDAGAGF